VRGRGRQTNEMIAAAVLDSTARLKHNKSIAKKENGIPSLKCCE